MARDLVPADTNLARLPLSLWNLEWLAVEYRYLVRMGFTAVPSSAIPARKYMEAVLRKHYGLKAEKGGA